MDSKEFNFVGRANFLKAIFPNARIVLVLRYQPELLRSVYQEHIFQNYLLTPEECFIPFAKHIFPEANYWKTTMQIDVKEWNYKETVKHFRSHYGKNFMVLFYENYSKDISGIGKNILEFSGCRVNGEVLNCPLPRVNVSCDATKRKIMLNIARHKLAFHSNVGFDSLSIQNLMEHANQAKFIFDATGVKDFLSRLKNRRDISNATYSNPRLDRQLLKIIEMYCKIYNYFKSQRYELPKTIRSHLEHESKILNSSLDDVVDKKAIPKQYL